MTLYCQIFFILLKKLVACLCCNGVEAKMLLTDISKPLQILSACLQGEIVNICAYFYFGCAEPLIRPQTENIELFYPSVCYLSCQREEWLRWKYYGYILFS